MTNETNTTVEVAVEKTLNQQIKDAGLWKPGMQFLSNKDKQRLLSVKDRTRKQIIKELDTKLAEISKKLSEGDREYKYTFNEETSKKGVNIVGDISQLKKYATPVKEQSVFYTVGTDQIPAPNHKAIVTPEGNIVSVVKNSYKLVRNEDIIMPVLEQLDKIDSKWKIDPSHSFMTEQRMRIQLTFPDLTFHDGDSDVAMSLFIHNSYDGSEGIKALWGAIRGICSNGMVFGKVFAKFYAKHTNGFQVENLNKQLEDTFEMIPTINDRVKLLKATEFKIEDADKELFTKTLGGRAQAYLEQENGKQQITNVWALYNVFTYYISHYVNYKTRAMYQQRLANMLNF